LFTWEERQEDSDFEARPGEITEKKEHRNREKKRELGKEEERKGRREGKRGG
jgi:hypothetical protein